MSYVPELNYNICDTLVISAESIEAIFDGDTTILDPDTTAAVGDDEISAGSDDSTYEADDTLEGQEIFNAMCRSEYDDNSLADTQKGFCCQAMFMDGGSEEASSAFAITTFATSVAAADPEEAVTFEFSGIEIEMHFGAEAFASAKGLAASFAAVVSTALVFAQ